MSLLVAHIGPGKTGPFGAAARAETDDPGWVDSPRRLALVSIVVGLLLLAAVNMLVRKKMDKG